MEHVFFFLFFFFLYETKIVSPPFEIWEKIEKIGAKFRNSNRKFSPAFGYIAPFAAA